MAQQPYDLTREAQQDLFDIWRRISSDSISLADRIEGEFLAMFTSLGRMPSQGHRREDLTKLPLRFFTLYSFMIAYRADLAPIRIMAVLSGRRNIKRILGERFDY